MAVPRRARKPSDREALRIDYLSTVFEPGAHYSIPRAPDADPMASPAVRRLEEAGMMPEDPEIDVPGLVADPHDELVAPHEDPRRDDEQQIFFYCDTCAPRTKTSQVDQNHGHC